jgi:hypothetical protein
MVSPISSLQSNAIANAQTAAAASGRSEGAKGIATVSNPQPPASSAVRAAVAILAQGGSN